MKLTKAIIEQAEAPESCRKERFIRDTEVRGLGLRITAGGAKSFIFEGRIKGRSRRITLGPWPDLTVFLARKKALQIRSAIANGADPAADAETARHEPRFSELVATYFERHAIPRKRSVSVRQDERLLERYVPAGWNARRLSDITRADVARLHEKVGEMHGRVAANRALALLRSMFNLARVWQLTKADNPTLGIALFREAKRERYLTPEEVARVNAALAEESDVWRAYFPLCLMLGVRRGELLAMRWSDIDFNARTWKIPTTKAGNSHLLPLPGPALAMLEVLPSRGQSEWVFPGDGVTGHIVEPGPAWERIRSRAGVADVRIHDLRHTLASWLVAQGFNLPLIGRALNHAQPSTTARYAHLALDPVRAALEQTAVLMTQGTAPLRPPGAA